MNPKEIATGVSIGGQPSAEDIEELKAKGYKTIVNVRTPQDDGYLAEEERLVENAGLGYAEIGISPKIIDDMAVPSSSAMATGKTSKLASAAISMARCRV